TRANGVLTSLGSFSTTRCSSAPRSRAGSSNGPVRGCNVGAQLHCNHSIRRNPMWRSILKYGVVAGLVVAACMWATLLAFDGGMPHGVPGMALGYLGMLVALAAVVVGIRRHRDRDRGGVIGFWPAFGLGLGISAVAGLFYVLAWELA